MKQSTLAGIACLLLSIPLILHSQEVFTTGGSHDTLGSFSFSSTIGEPISETFIKQDIVFTQGFQQPFTVSCLDPVNGGTIGNPQFACGSLNPDSITNVDFPSGFLGVLEYAWLYSIISSSSGFDTIFSNDSVFDPPMITQTTWYKRIVRVDCSNDWAGAAESNVIEMTVYPLPTADFSADTVCHNDTTHFLDISLPPNPATITNWAWDFNSGESTAVVQHPDYVFNNPGIFPVRLVVVNSNQCTDTVIQNIEVHELPNVIFHPIVPDTLCQTPFGISLTTGTPKGGTYSGPGVVNPNFYPLLVLPGIYDLAYGYTDGNGCFSSDTASVSVFSLPQVSHPPMEVCEDVPLLALTGGLPASGTYSGSFVNGSNFDVGTAGVGTHLVKYSWTDTVGCTNSADFLVVVHALPQVFHNNMNDVCENAGTVLLSGGTPSGGTYSGNFVSPAKFYPDLAGPGTHNIIYSWQDAQTLCTGQSIFTITVLDAPEIIISGDDTLCLGECTVLMASGGDSYLWSTGLTTPSITLCPPSTQTFNITVTNTNGCSAIKDFTITILPLPPATASGDTICPGETAILTAAGGVDYQWNNNMHGAVIQAAPLQTTNYIVTVTGANGCSATATATVIVLPPPPAYAGPDVSICLDDCTILSASGGIAYLWPDGSTNSDTIVCPLVTTTYIVTVTGSNGCTATDDVTVTVMPLPPAFAGNDITVCAGTETVLTATGGIAYAWSTGDLSNTISVFPADTTTYIVTVTGQNTCTATDDVIVNTWPAPIASAGGGATIHIGDTIQLNGTVSSGTPPYTFNWSPPGHLSDPGIANPMSFPKQYTIFKFTVGDVKGCVDEDEFILDVEWFDNSIKGSVLYNNQLLSPLDCVIVVAQSFLKSNQFTLTDGMGEYFMEGLADGGYIVFADADGLYPVGGINSTDALMALKNGLLFINLDGLFFAAGDVNADNNVNAVDALLIMQNFVNPDSGFVVGEWVFEGNSIQLENDTMLNLDIMGLCFGDINASYEPNTKASTPLLLELDGDLIVKSGSAIDIPVKVDRAVEIGAISLVLPVPSDIKVHDVTMNNNEAPLYFTHRNNQLRIAWASEYPLQLQPNETILNIKSTIPSSIVNRQSSIVNHLSIGTESEISDKDGKEISNLKLLLPNLTKDEANILFTAWPNPTNGLINLDVRLPGDERVTLELFNSTGHKVIIIFEGELSRGNHSMEVDLAKLPSGVYNCRMTVTGNEKPEIWNKRIIVIQ